MKNTQEAFWRNTLSDALRGWVMIVLTLGFIILYGLALVGKLRPLADVSLVSRLEPIIFVIIGYYFGRMPALQNEKTLRDEIGRQVQKADAAQHAKEQAQQSREALEEKVKNVSATLNAPPGLPSARFADELAKKDGSGRNEEYRYSVSAALRVLHS